MIKLLPQVMCNAVCMRKEDMPLSNALYDEIDYLVDLLAQYVELYGDLPVPNRVY